MCTRLYFLLPGGGGFLKGSFSPALTASLMTLPSPKLTVEGIGTKGVAQAAEINPLALVFCQKAALREDLLGGKEY